MLALFNKISWKLTCCNFLIFFATGWFWREIYALINQRLYCSSHTFTDSKGSTTWHDTSQVVCSTLSHASRLMSFSWPRDFPIFWWSCDQVCLVVIIGINNHVWIFMTHMLTTYLQNLQTTAWCILLMAESAGSTVSRQLFCWTLWRWRMQHVIIVCPIEFVIRDAHLYIYIYIYLNIYISIYNIYKIIYIYIYAYTHKYV